MKQTRAVKADGSYRGKDERRNILRTAERNLDATAQLQLACSVYYDWKQIRGRIHHVPKSKFENTTQTKGPCPITELNQQGKKSFFEPQVLSMIVTRKT